MSRRVVRAILLFALPLTGCPTTAGDDDSAGDDDDIHYEPGCITLNGEDPGFAHLQDAITVATAGDEIEVCGGEFEGSVVIEKSLTIRGEDPDDTVLVGDTNEMAVTIRDAANVVLSGFTVESSRDAVVVQLSTGVVLEDLIVESSGQVGISVEGSEVTIADSEFADHPYAAVDASGSTVEVSGCTFEDLVGYGIRLKASNASVVDSTLESVVPQTETDDYDGTCILADDSTVTVDQVEISACTRVGVYGIGSDLHVSSSTVSDCANGIAGIGGRSEGSSVVDCTLEEAPFFGVLLADQDAVVSGNTLQLTDVGGETSGIAVGGDNASFEIRDNQVSGYGQIGIWVQYPFGGATPTGGSAVVTGNTVTDIQLHGMLVQSLDEAEVADNTVQGISWGGELSNGGYVDGFGLNLWEIGELSMSGNEVSDVDVVGIYLIDTTFTSLDDQVSETGMWGVLINQCSGSFEGLLVNNTSVCGVDVRTSGVEFVDTVIRNVHQGIPPEYWEDGWPMYYYAHGALLSDSQCSFVDSWFLDDQDWALELYDTDISVEGTIFRGIASYGVYSSYGFGEIRDSTFEDMGYAIYLENPDADSQIGDLTVADNLFSGVSSALYSSNLAGTTAFEGNQVESTTSYGLYLADSVADGAVVEVRNNSFSTPAGSAVYASGIELQMEGANAVDGVQNGAAAVALHGVTGTVSGLSVTGSTGPGLTVAGGSDLTLTGCQLVGSVGHNLHVSDSTVQVFDNPALSEGSSAGIKLEGTVQGSITGNTIQDNAAYGIHCDSPDVVLDACDNVMGGNTPEDLYEENGCALSCTVQ